ncbi:alpha/beta hydrolase [Legionella rowbothamii]|uniref:alpha/beta hydrolase n=1 Tax=Legionella rowbothamii TaxID=96229 RepID=UPI001F5FDB15|nr:alpha/beta hydrolase [Legionella rowbothamii]
MYYILRIVLVFFFIISTSNAEHLEIKLNGKSIKFPYWSALKDPHGAIVVINGGEQAQWSDFLEYVAKNLSDFGWSTVLLNCDSGSTEPWVKALPETINTLRQQKNNRIVVIHYGEQAAQTLTAFDKQAGIEGLVLLSAYDLSKAEDKKDDKKIELKVPIFDIAGQFDYAAVLEQMQERKRDFAQNKYTSMKVPGANHDYEYNQPMVVSSISGWMLKLTENKPKPPPVLVSYVASIAPLITKDNLVLDDELEDWAGYNNDPPEPTQEIIVQKNY